MITLQLAAPPQWVLIDLGDGQSIEVQLTPPSYDTQVRDGVESSMGETAILRLSCVTGWRGVQAAREDGAMMPVPFSRAALAVLLRTFPPALRQLLVAVRPLFEGQSETERKNSSAPPDAAT